MDLQKDLIQSRKIREKITMAEIIFKFKIFWVVIAWSNSENDKLLNHIAIDYYDKKDVDVKMIGNDD